jgi:hypothetical protein
VRISLFAVSIRDTEKSKPEKNIYRFCYAARRHVKLSDFSLKDTPSHHHLRSDKRVRQLCELTLYVAKFIKKRLQLVFGVLLFCLKNIRFKHLAIPPVIWNVS